MTSTDTPTVGNRAIVVGRLLAWLSAAVVAGLAGWMVAAVDSERPLVAFWGALMTAIALYGAIVSSTTARVVSGTVLGVFAFVGGFSIGGAFSPGALLMLLAATLPDARGRPWIDRALAIPLVTLGALAVERINDASGRWVVLLAPVVAAAIMWRSRHWRALPWALLVFPFGYALFDVAYRFVLGGD